MMNEDILRDINALPIEAQRQVEDFIAFLRQRYKSSPRPENLETDIASEEFIGVWRDREEMHDGTTWVRNTRQSHW